MSVFEDGRTLKLYRDPQRSAAGIARFSKKDAETFLKVSKQAAAWLPMIAAQLYAPPAPVGASNAMLDQSAEGRALWRIIQMSSFDHLADLFESEQVQMHFARVAGENLVSPDEKATAIGAYVFLGFLEAYGFGVARGGAGKLTDALIACIRDHGGEVIANADVARIKVSNGRATAVETVDGRVFAAQDAIHRRHPSTPAGRHDRWAECAGARRCRGHAHHQRRLHHRACRAGCTAAVLHRGHRGCGDGRVAAGEL